MSGLIRAKWSCGFAFIERNRFRSQVLSKHRIFCLARIGVCEQGGYGVAIMVQIKHKILAAVVLESRFVPSVHALDNELVVQP